MLQTDATEIAIASVQFYRLSAMTYRIAFFAFLFVFCFGLLFSEVKSKLRSLLFYERKFARASKMFRAY